MLNPFLDFIFHDRHIILPLIFCLYYLKLFFFKYLNVIEKRAIYY